MMTVIFSLFLFHPKQPKDALRWFIPILMIILIGELIGGYYKSKHIANAHLYNILEPIFTLGYLLIMREILQNSVQKSIITILVVAYFGVCVINLLFFQGFMVWNTWSIIVGSLFLTITSIMGFYELSVSKSMVSLRKTPLFWISSSFLLYFLPSMVLLSIFDFLPNDPSILKSYGIAFHQSQEVLNVFHYGLLSFSFLCRLIFQT